MQLNYCHLFEDRQFALNSGQLLILSVIWTGTRLWPKLFYLIPQVEAFLKMSAARDKWVLTSGVLNQWCEKQEKGTTKIRTNPIRCRSQYHCRLRGHQLSRECTDMSLSVAAIVMQPFLLTPWESLLKSRRVTCSNRAFVSLFGTLSAGRERWRREGHWSGWWGHC